MDLVALSKRFKIGAALTAFFASMWAAVKRRKGDGDDASQGGPTKEDPDDPQVPEPKPKPDPKPTGEPEPIAVGQPGDPEIASLLDEMRTMFRDAGINTDQLSPYEVTVMPKTPNKTVAIPPREFWPRMVQTLVNVVQPLRTRMGIPFMLRGYRPPDYNAAVGGASNSRHIYFEGVDIYLVGPENTSQNRRKLALEAARIYLQAPSSLRMGFGAYGKPSPSNIHVDTGWKKRTWREAPYYIQQVKAVT